MMNHTQRRREFLSTTTGFLLGAAAAPVVSASSAEPDDRIAFFVIGDTHYLADKHSPTKLSVESEESTMRFLTALAGLPGSEIAAEAGGGRVAIPRGLIHCGDIIDTGDKNGGPHEQMQRTEFAKFVEDYGLTGRDGKLPYPVYELHGNHDGPRGTGHAVEQIIERNRTRPGVVSTSDNGLHYSWDWGPLHCVCLGLTVGVGSGLTERRRYDPLGSVDFLAADLDRHVGRSGRPVVVAHHLDLARNCVPCVSDDPPKSTEWDPCDVAAFYDAIGGYNVAAIFYGHTHGRAVHRWDGATAKAAEGIALFNVDDSSHFHGKAQGLFYVELTGRQLTVREYATRDNWQTAAWTPQSWNVPLTAKA